MISTFHIWAFGALAIAGAWVFQEKKVFALPLLILGLIATGFGVFGWELFDQRTWSNVHNESGAPIRDVRLEFSPSRLAISQLASGSMVHGLVFPDVGSVARLTFLDGNGQQHVAEATVQRPLLNYEVSVTIEADGKVQWDGGVKAD